MLAGSSPSCFHSATWGTFLSHLVPGVGCGSYGNSRPSLYPIDIPVWNLGAYVGNPSLKTLYRVTLWWPLFSAGVD